MLAALNLTLWFGCLTTISCADCIQAYLQCLLEGNTLVILPFELWLEEWKKIYDPSVRLEVKLIKSLYGHPQSGKLWQAHLERQLIDMKGIPLETYPSNFVFKRRKNDEHTLILSIYVDDLTLAGGTKEIQQEFWKELQQRAKVEPEEFISETGTKILGRTHVTQRTSKQVSMTYHMSSYATGIVGFYCELTGMPVEKLRKVETPCFPESPMSEEELAREGALHNHAAKVLMRCLWLSRLARPDLSFAVHRLASRVTRWTLWEDRQMLRLISYMFTQLLTS